MTDREPTRLEAEGYARIRELCLPAAKAVLGIDAGAFGEALDFASRGVKRVEANPRIDAASRERSRNELDVLKAAWHFRKALEKLAQGQEARDRIVNG